MRNHSNFLIFITFIIAIGLVLTQPVLGFTAAITPPKVDILVNASKGLPQNPSTAIIVSNLNDFPVKIKMRTTGDLGTKIKVTFSKNNFTMPPKSEERVKVTFKVDKVGNYTGKIVTEFTMANYTVLGGASMVPVLAQITEVNIKVVGKPPSPFGIPGFELSCAILGAIIAIALRRYIKL